MKWTFWLLMTISGIALLPLPAPGDPGTFPFIAEPAVGPTPTPTPSPTLPPTIIPAAMDIDALQGPLDNGATPDKYLFYMINANQETTMTSACGTSSAPLCIQVKYTDMLSNHCNTQEENDAMTWGFVAHETAFLHIYGAGQVSTNRLQNGNQPNTFCAAFNGSPTLPFYFNPDNAAFATWIYPNIWANTGNHYHPQTPQSWGVYEDDPNQQGNKACGANSGQVGQYPSGEYSKGFNGGATVRCDQLGNSSYNQGEPYLTALGHFITNGCQATCLNFVYNGGSNLANSVVGQNGSHPCSVLEGSVPNKHCHVQTNTQIIDDQYNFDQLCDTANAGNFVGMDEEKPILGQYAPLPAPTPSTISTQQLIWLINGHARWINYANCNGAKLFNLEYGFGQAGPGVPAPTPSPGTDDWSQRHVRTLVTAVVWMIADPVTQIPDRELLHYGTLGGQTGHQNESGYYFEQSMVPWQAEHSVATFTWNGANGNGSGTTTYGGGCESSTANHADSKGDAHGIIDLLTLCNNSGGANNDGAGVYTQQYQHLLIDTLDYGKMAIVIDTSATSDPPIVPGMFTGDPWTSYTQVLTLSDGELKSVLDADAPGGVISLPQCTNANCITYPTAGTQSTAWSTSSPGTLCDGEKPPCAKIFLQNPVP